MARARTGRRPARAPHLAARPGRHRARHPGELDTTTLTLPGEVQLGAYAPRLHEAARTGLATRLVTLSDSTADWAAHVLPGRRTGSIFPTQRASTTASAVPTATGRKLAASW